MIVLDSSSKVTETFDHLSYLPLATVQGLLKALQVHIHSHMYRLAHSTFLVFTHIFESSTATTESQHDLKRCLDTCSTQSHVFQVCIQIIFLRVLKKHN